MNNKDLRAELLKLCERAGVPTLPRLDADLFDKYKKDIEPYLDDSYVFGSQVAISMITAMFPPQVRPHIEDVGRIFLYVWYQKIIEEKETTFDNVTYTT